MHKVVFDFKNINNRDEFYSELRKKIEVPDYFGDNLDALWDIITSREIKLPLEIIFRNFNRSRNSYFRKIEELFNDAEIEMNGEIRFKIL